MVLRRLMLPSPTRPFALFVASSGAGRARQFKSRAGGCPAYQRSGNDPEARQRTCNNSASKDRCTNKTRFNKSLGEKAKFQGSKVAAMARPASGRVALSKAKRSVATRLLPTCLNKRTGRQESYLALLYLTDFIGFIGSGGRDRTYDQLINSQLLYR